MLTSRRTPRIALVPFLVWYAATGAHVRVLTDLVAGVAPTSSAAALEELRAAGVETVPAG